MTAIETKIRTDEPGWNRTNEVTVSFSASEMAAIEAQASASGVTPEELIYRLALDEIAGEVDRLIDEWPDSEDD